MQDDTNVVSVFIMFVQLFPTMFALFAYGDKVGLGNYPSKAIAECVFTGMFGALWLAMVAVMFATTEEAQLAGLIVFSVVNTLIILVVLGSSTNK